MTDKHKDFYVENAEEMAKVVSSMHEIVRALNDEEAYFNWIDLVPDEPSDADFKYIAEDKELLSEVIARFRWIIVHYVTKPKPKTDDKLYWVRDVNSMGTTHYLSKEAYEKEGEKLRQCLLWTGAPEELRAKLTKKEAEEAVNLMKTNNPYSSSTYSIVEVK